MRLRLLVYNVKSFRLGVHNTASLVAEHGPDVALIQECGPRRRLRRFASALDMEAAAHHHLFRRSIHNAVLVRPPWRVVSQRLHPFPRDQRFYPRGIMLARLGRAGFRLWAGSVHLGLEGEARRRNADELVSLVMGIDGPLVVGGDLNEGPNGPAVRWIADRLWDGFAVAGEGPGETFPADGPTARIDYVFVNEGVKVDRAWVLGGPAAAAGSDHLPVFTDLVLTNGDDGRAGADPVG